MELEEQDVDLTMGVEDDEQIKVINDLKTDEEIKAAKELILEDTEKDEKGGTNKETSLKEPEKDTPKEFSVTQEFINSQPEENRALFETFLGKNKEELAKAAANAIAVKNLYIKDNEQAIAAIAEKIKAETDENMIKAFIDAKKEVGKTEKTKKEPAKEPKKIELPELEDTPEVKKLIQSEAIKKLRDKYPSMPTDVNSVAYKEWERDILDGEGISKVIQIAEDMRTARAEVAKDLKTVVYFKNNWAKINNERIADEVKGIEANLKQLGLTPKDLGVDLTLTKNEKNGLLENPVLNDLALSGNEVDANIIGYVGEGENSLAFYKNHKDAKGRTPLMKKFMLDNATEIISILSNREDIGKKKEIERVKETNLNTLQDSKTSSSKSTLLTPEEISKIQDENLIKKEKERIFNLGD